ncbi:MAG: N-acetylmuramoyl-L-alanine amidase [Clostridiales bacterium]|nr:N-acetylmuramoyl-L-alanine amidase [Clostridiales bacterium]
MIKIPGQSVRSVEESEKKKQRAVKLFQYFMIVVLFTAAVLLPAYGAGRRAAKTQGEADGADAVNANRIVIDPGHGGMDSGMVGESGVSEKELNLVCSKKLAALLEAAGYDVVLTRETEDGLYDADASNKKAQDMERRVARIAEENPILTVSIHQNSYPEDSSVKGPQVFYFEQSAEGEKLAAAIQESLNTELAVERPRTQKGNTTYYILKRSVSTTVIVECGFLTNPEEEALLQEEEYQDRVAQAICDGILAYLESKAGE